MPTITRPKILLLIPHLGGGGAERVTELLAKNLSTEKYELHLGLITQAEITDEKLIQRIQIHALGARRVRTGAFRLLCQVRRIQPDLILSGMAHLNFIVLLLRPFFPRGTRVLVRQNATVSASLAFGNPHSYTRILYRFLYRRADCIICQTPSMAGDLARELRISESQLSVLPNPLDVEEIRNLIRKYPAQHANSKESPRLLAVGRLSPEKGLDLLLQAMAQLRKHLPGVTLTIAGTGPEESALKIQCHALELDNVVRFAGYLARPWQLYPETTLFVLPSRHEGLPNALLEAAAGGLPIVATPASGGISELLRNQPGVWLAPEISANALAATLLAALQSLQPGERFPHPFIETFHMDRAMRAYECLIDQILGQRP